METDHQHAKQEQFGKGTKWDYLKNSGQCPFCGSDDIVGDSYDYEGDTVTQEISCSSCHKTWNDIYKLVDVEETV